MILRKNEPCGDLSMGKHACKNRHQCFEPCGALGHDVDHARVASLPTQVAINKALCANISEPLSKTIQNWVEP